jgi:hypothetical protein
LEAQLLKAEDADDAKYAVRHHLRPAIRRDGRVICQLGGGGVVSGEARFVRVSQVTAGAAFLGLSLTAERFGPRPIVVQGTAEFRAKVATLAGQKDLAVSFADPKLEARCVLAAIERMRAAGRKHGRADGLHR